MPALTLGALGVVFGDIGTSPLYALQTVFAANDQAVSPDEAGVYGVISLVFCLPERRIVTWAPTLSCNPGRQLASPHERAEAKSRCGAPRRGVRLPR